MITSQRLTSLSQQLVAVVAEQKTLLRTWVTAKSTLSVWSPLTEGEAKPAVENQFATFHLQEQNIHALWIIGTLKQVCAPTSRNFCLPVTENFSTKLSSQNSLRLAQQECKSTRLSEQEIAK